MKLTSKKLFIVGYAITGILLACLVAYLDSNTDRSVYLAAIATIGSVAGVHNYVQGKIDERKEGKKDAAN